MTRKTLTVLESPWEDDDGDIGEHSMRPFVEGLCELNDWMLIYRTFTSRPELTRLVNGEAFDRRASRALLYVACHATQGRLQAGIRTPLEINLAGIGRDLVKDVEGVWLGACDIGASSSLGQFLDGGGAIWAGGYSCSVDWDAAMLIDIAVLQTIMSSGPITTTASTLRSFVAALERFDPAWAIGSDANDEDAPLGDSVELMARNKGGSAEDLTDALRRRLHWERGA